MLVMIVGFSYWYERYSLFKFTKLALLFNIYIILTPIVFIFDAFYGAGGEVKI